MNVVWKLFTGSTALFLTVMTCFHIAIQQVSDGNVLDGMTVFLSISVLVVVIIHVFVYRDEG